MRNHWNCDPQRIKIVDAVEAYRAIAYGGSWRNNVGGMIDNKIQFIAGYKFNLALENSRLQGYVTEKILEPLAASTVPLYWGAPDVCKDFNSDAFINIADYNSLADFLSAIVEERRRYTTRYGEAGNYHRRRILLVPFSENGNLMRMAKLIRLCYKPHHKKR